MIIIFMNQVISEDLIGLDSQIDPEAKKENEKEINKTKTFTPPPMRRMNATHNLQNRENLARLVTRSIYKKGMTS
jgi:hypothetical protein